MALYHEARAAYQYEYDFRQERSSNTQCPGCGMENEGSDVDDVDW